MISIEHIGVEFSARPLFADISYVINDRDRIALVGKNGAGKSTMLKIIAGLQQPTSGTVAIPKGTSIGYLPQVMILSDSRTVRQEAELAFCQLHELEARLAQMNQELADRTDYDSPEYMQLVETFTHESERFQMMGGMNYQAELERTLMGLGFERTDFERPTSEFSGGWRMRIELAKLLLRRPDILLLDEPTNHLDIQSIQWLETFLATKASAVVLVSHDRAFINNVTNRTMEISCGRLYDYKVKYDEYINLRAERREQQLRAYENQQKEIADIKAFIDRFRYQATKAIQVQSRIKQLERIIPIEVDEVDNSRRRGARREDLSDASLLQSRDIAFGDNAAADDQGVFHALLTNEVDNLREEMRMRTGKDAHRNNIDVLIGSRLSNLLRSLAEARVDDLKTGVAQSARNNLGTAIMTIQTGLSN